MECKQAQITFNVVNPKSVVKKQSLPYTNIFVQLFMLAINTTSKYNVMLYIYQIIHTMATSKYCHIFSLDEHRKLTSTLPRKEVAKSK